MSSINFLVKQFNLLDKWFNAAVAGITDEESNRRVNPEMNHIKYLTGHLVNSLFGIAGASGVKVERKWDDIFGGGRRTKALDDFNYPTMDTLISEWNNLAPEVKRAIANLSEANLAEELLGSFLANSGMFDGSKGDFLTFMNQHQIYHIGQIAILRRALGKEPAKLF